MLVCATATGPSCPRKSAPPPADTGTGDVTSDALAASRVPSTADAPGAYQNAAGPFEVGVLTASLDDPSNEKQLPILVRWPRELRDAGQPTPGSFPLVIFSHGAGGSSDAFPELSDHWAGHGYVVVHPTHSDSVKLRREQGERIRDFANAAQQVVSKVRPQERVADVVLILDSLAQIEEMIAQHAPDSAAGDGEPRDPAVPASAVMRIDRERIAIAGHSAGALTAQMLAGVRFTGRGSRLIGNRTFRDPRIKAAIVISGQGLGRPAFSADSWKKIEIPMMVYAGSNDHSPVSDETPAGRRHPFEYAPPGDKYLVYIDGATHGAYQGRETARILREGTPDNIDYITDVVAFGTLSFLDAYLKNDPAARAYLASDEITRYPGGRVEFRRK
ncbi:Alpha/beta hydrolase family protein [Phycisphaerae bacterium RAS1]|nr:Alpha/beta hydrolase family protein [Phycisphaerae bacterium RAS1]